VVIDGDRERTLGFFLANDVFLEEVVNLFGLGQIEVGDGLATVLRLTLINDFVTELNTLITDIDARSRNELLDLLLAFATERTLEELAGIACACHEKAFLHAIWTLRSLPPRA
jgi:hypothetical protein